MNTLPENALRDFETNRLRPALPLPAAGLRVLPHVPPPRRGARMRVLGGIVSLGSNVSTLQQTAAAIGAAEQLRSDLIGRIDLRVVGDGRPN